MPSATATEIASQPMIWQSVLSAMHAQWSPLHIQVAPLVGQPVLVTGCGSPYYLALSLAAVLRHAGVAASALPASELALLPIDHLPPDTLLLTVSRSGTTSEVLWACERFRRERPDGRIAAISCTPDTLLVQQAHVALLAPQAQEQSVAQTRTFTSMALLGQVFTALLTNDLARLTTISRLPAALESVMQRTKELAEALGSDLSIDRLFFLGHGALYGMACEAMLKTKEMTCSWSEAYHPLEFRHGPMSVAGAGALVVGLISDTTAREEISVLRHMKRLGSRTLALIENAEGHDWSGVDEIVALHSGIDVWQRGALYLPFIQQMALHRALAKGLDPDQPTNLTAVVQL